MKKTSTLSITFIAFIAFVIARNFTITISGTTYIPNLLTVNITDNIVISASTVQPFVQARKATWITDGSTLLS